MSEEEPRSAATFRLYSCLAALPVFWGVVFYVLAVLLPEQVRSQIGLDMGLCVGATVPLLIVSGLMLEQAFAARRGDGPPPE
jgi:hypothetical protein